MQLIEKQKLESIPRAGGVVSVAPVAELRRVDSRELFAAASELLIDHEGASYRLRITRQGKLILTK